MIDNDKWFTLERNIRSIFTPTAPINNRDLFVGRKTQISKILDTILQPGAHAIVYGERGVGKTSLVSILQQLLDDKLLTGITISKTICDISDTYYSICKKIFSNFTITENKSIINTKQGTLDIPDTLDFLLPEQPSPDDVRKLILTLRGKHLIAIIDEFDSVANNLELTHLIANTIKILSDTRSPSTFIIVGIGDTVEGLISQHLSIDRCLNEIAMPRMTLGEMEDLVNNGITNAGMKIDTDAVKYICRISQGLPSYVHLLCRESAIIAIQKHESNITKAHAIEGLHHSLGLVPGILAQNWDKATASTKPNNMFKQVLIACALATKNELGFFSAGDVKDPIRAITHKDYEIPGYGGSLHLLTDPKRASILDKVGESHRWRYRFTNPLMEPYAIMYGLSKGLIDESIVDEFRADI